MARINKKNEIEREFMGNLNETQRNELAVQYMPLITKLTAQYNKKCALGWNVIFSMAEEGFAMAINNFNPERSKMTFTQYAAFEIRNNILNCLNREAHAVVLNAYAVSNMKAAGESTFTSVSMTTITGEAGSDENAYSREGKYGLFEEMAEGNPVKELIDFVEENFSTEICEIFFKSFGLNGYDIFKGTELAKEYGVSQAAITNRVRKVVTAIKANEDLVEQLSTLL